MTIGNSWMRHIQTPRAIMRKLFALTLLAGCGFAPPPAGYLPTPDQMERAIAAPPDRVVTAATSVFAEAGLLPAVVDAKAGLLTSAPLTVKLAWGTAPVKDRVYCGKAWDSGVEYALSNPVQVVLGIVATAADKGSRMKLIVNATATQESALGGATKAQPCQLTAAFAKQLMDTIAARATQ